MIQIPKVFKFLFEPKRYKIAYGGRGSGKSTSIALALLILGKQKKKRILCAREVQNSIQDSVHKLLKDLINENEELSDYEVLQNVIRHPNGTEFIFKGLYHNVNDIKSTEGINICWVEEAHAVSAKSWDVLVPTIREEDSEIWISFNPELEDDPTYDRFVKNADEDTIVVKVNYDQNPFFSDVLRAEMERDRKRDIDNYLHIWEGEFRKTVQSAVFRNWEIEEFEAPDDAVHRFGADWGFAADPTTLIRCHIIGRKLYIDYEAYQVGCEIVDTPSLFLTIPESEKYPIVADSARPETISHMRKNGFPKMMASIKGKGSVDDGVEWLKSFDIIVHPRCEHTIDELKKYSYKIDPLTGQVIPKLEDKNNHMMDALRYACEGARRLSQVKKVPVVDIPVYSPFAR